MTLTEIRNLVRLDLHDADPDTYRWSDAALDRHIAHALRDFSQSVPREQTADLFTTPGSRQVSLDSLGDDAVTEGVEYPLDQLPLPAYSFLIWNQIVTLEGPDVPDGSPCRVYYTVPHTLDETGSSVPDHLVEVLVAGAAGYAALEQSVFCINQVNVGGAAVPQDWRDWGQAKLDYFHHRLKKLDRARRLKCRTLFTTPDLHFLPSLVWGPSL